MKGRIGDAVPRREDDRLLRGFGCYLDDLPELPGTLHLIPVRSPYAHARILSVDVVGARELDGIVAVLGGREMSALVKPMQPDLPLPGIQVIQRPAVCTDRVRFVGDIVAVVVAENPYVAEDAAELVGVEYEQLPAVTTPEEAMSADAPLLHESAVDNVLYRAGAKSPGFDAAFAAAPHVFTETFTSGRVHVVSMEPRGCMAVYDRGKDSLTFWGSTQVPHMLRTALSEQLDLPDSRVRVIAPDVGGGFGMKASIYPEDFIVAALSRHLRAPVKWAQDRHDDLLTSAHAREFSFTLSLAVDDQARLIAMKLYAVVNAGAYGSYPLGASLEAAGGPRTIPGPYRFSQFAYETRAVATNTCPTSAFRAVAAPISFFALEGMMDRVARGLGLDPAEVRRRNLLRSDEFPYVNVNGIRYDNGSYQECLSQALEIADYANYRRAQPPSRLVDGKYRGVGIATITEQTGQGGARYRARGLYRIPGYDAATVRIEPSGKAIALISHATQGQGHLTTFAQIVADEIGLPFEDVSVVEGDTGLVPFGSGTFASRAMITGGGAVLRASVKVREKIQRLAGQLLEASPADIIVEDGFASVRGVPKLRVSVREVARMAYSMTTHALPEGETFGLEALDTYDPPVPAVGNAAHVAFVAVDAATGQVTVERYVVVHDCGRIVNPMIVEGQTHGAVAQGVGTALWEEIRYDRDGQPLTTTLMDYTIPTMLDLPNIEVAHIETPCLDTVGGFKGMAESGTIGAVPAIANAVGDALAAFCNGVARIPLKPEYLRSLIDSGKRTFGEPAHERKGDLI